MKKAALPLFFLLCYLSIIFPFASYMKSKPFAEKIGYVPQAEIMRLLAADQKQFTAASLIMKAILYFGSLAEKNQNKIEVPPDYAGMYRTMETAIKLDPFNMDGYYFAQAILVWDIRQIKLANDLLEYGMKYRTWDFYLPFFAGFNYAYFLRDFENAAKYYRKVGELTGDSLSINLAGRYMYEAGQTDHAIAYLSVMEKGARNEAIKKSFQIRLNALKETRRVELAIGKYRQEKKAAPSSIGELVEKRYLERPPVDPYGGTFYIDEKGQVRSTSKFAFGGRKQ